MGLIDKAKKKLEIEVQDLSKKECDFILTKLRTADYKGNEFEMFYRVFKKITDYKETLP